MSQGYMNYGQNNDRVENRWHTSTHPHTLSRGRKGIRKEVMMPLYSVRSFLKEYP
jgi:hypothetical protein